MTCPGGRLTAALISDPGLAGLAAAIGTYRTNLYDGLPLNFMTIIAADQEVRGQGGIGGVM